MMKEIYISAGTDLETAHTILLEKEQEYGVPVCANFNGREISSKCTLNENWKSVTGYTKDESEFADIVVGYIREVCDNVKDKFTDMHEYTEFLHNSISGFSSYWDERKK